MDINFYNGKPFKYHGTHNGVDYWIVSAGFHPLAYVKADKIDYIEEIYFDELECHGAISFKGFKVFSGTKENVFGWDYAHFMLNDYSTLFEKWIGLDSSKLKRWTFSEVEKEVFDFIDKYKLQEENETTDISNRKEETNDQ